MFYKTPTYFFGLFFLLSGSVATAQTAAKLPEEMADSSEFKSLLFARFTDGLVLMKSNKMVQALLNYNTNHQSIVFTEDNKYLTLTGLHDIDTVYLQHKKFIPVKNSFYEVIGESPDATLVVSYTSQVRPLVGASDHNGTSKQVGNQVSNTMSDTYVSGNFKGNYNIEILRHFWVKKGTVLYRADTRAQLQRIFPQRPKEEVDDYISANNLNISLTGDLATLVNYLSKR